MGHSKGKEKRGEEMTVTYLNKATRASASSATPKLRNASACCHYFRPNKLSISLNRRRKWCVIQSVVKERKRELQTQMVYTEVLT